MLKVLKWLAISLAVLVGLPVVAYIAFGLVAMWSSAGVGVDGNPGSWLLRSLFHDGPRYFELTAELEVEGEPVKITRVVECQPYFYHYDTWYFRKQWYMTNSAMTHRLRDGSGVIVVIPEVCERLARPQPANAPPWSAIADLPADFVPLIAWTADADNPDALEVYHSFEALERADARVHFKSIVLRNDSSLQPSDSPDEFGLWINADIQSQFKGGQPDHRLNYIGYYLVPIEEKKWREIPELKATLSDMTSSEFLSKDVKSIVNLHFRTSTDYDMHAIGSGLTIRTLSEYRDKKGKKGDFKYNVLDEMLGFQRTEAGYVSKPEFKGLITYYPLVKNENDINSESKKALFFVDGGAVDWLPNIWKLYYDHNKKNIYSLEKSYLTFYGPRIVTNQGE